VFTYTSNSSGLTYVLNTTTTDQPSAQSSCNDQGGHLVSWRSLAEQREAEQYFTSRGLLFPVYHQSYWIGLVATDSEPRPQRRPPAALAGAGAPLAAGGGKGRP
jgi:hypothetical protein